MVECFIILYCVIRRDMMTGNAFNRYLLRIIQANFLRTVKDGAVFVKQRECCLNKGWKLTAIPNRMYNSNCSKECQVLSWPLKSKIVVNHLPSPATTKVLTFLINTYYGCAQGIALPTFHGLCMTYINRMHTEKGDDNWSVRGCTNSMLSTILSWSYLFCSVYIFWTANDICFV